MTVISIMHDADLPKSATGSEFFDSVLCIADGVASKAALVTALPAEITTILTVARPPAERRALPAPK